MIHKTLTALVVLLKLIITIELVSSRPIQQNNGNSDLLTDEYYDDYDSNVVRSVESSNLGNGKCQNGGFNILESDWCACGPEFTGRYCEIEIEPDNRNGCGKKRLKFSFSFNSKENRI